MKNLITPVDILKIPNIVTFLRLVILPFILVYFTKGQNVVAFCLLLLAGFTDILDGFLARKLNQRTALGKLLDPVVDKIFFLMIIVFLVFYADFPLWGFLAIIILEFLILIGSFILIKKYKLIPSSNIFGKIAVTLLSLAISMYLLDLNFFKQIIFTNISLQFLTLMLSILLLILAVISYIKSAKNKINIE